jgi:hypothetical protein
MEAGLDETKLDSGELDLVKTFINSDINKPGGNPLRNPLHLALSISPLLLIMPGQLLKSRVGRKNLLDVS